MVAGLVSVIIPTFNRKYCIRDCLDSVLGQKYQNFEIVLIDDGSSDGTGDLVSAEYGHDPRVRYFFQENAGVTKARNHGIRRCRGDYVAFLDSDDTWSEWKLQVQTSCMARRPELGMVWSDMEAVGPGGEVVSPSYLTEMYGAYRWFRREELFRDSVELGSIAPGLPGPFAGSKLYTGYIYSQMFMGNLVHTSTVMLTRERAEAVGGFREDLLRSGEDYDFHMRTCEKGDVGYIDAPLIRYRVGMPDRLTHKSYSVDVARNCLKTIQPVLESNRAAIELPEQMIRLRMAEVEGWLGEALLEARDYREGRAHLRKSLRHHAGQPRLVGLMALSYLPESLRTAAKGLVRAMRRAPAPRTPSQEMGGGGSS